MREECSDGLIFNYFRAHTNCCEIQRNLLCLLRWLKSKKENILTSKAKNLCYPWDLGDKR